MKTRKLINTCAVMAVGIIVLGTMLNEDAFVRIGILALIFGVGVAVGEQSSKQDRS